MSITSTTAPPIEASPPSGSGTAPRVALYGHDTMGLGHMRRNLALAGAMAGCRARPDILVLTGSAECSRFPLPDRVDLVSVPGVAKNTDGDYRTRRFAMGLDDTVAVRSAVLDSALSSFAPDLMVVDKVALGFQEELVPALALLRERGTRLVLGLRDVLDAPGEARRDWRRQRTTEALRDYYDEVWVYGDRRIVDVAEEYQVPPGVRDLFRYTGYLAEGRGARPAPAADDHPTQPYVLCMLGGGQDGARLADAFSTARLPDGMQGILLAGPDLPAGTVEEISRRAAENPALRVVPFATDCEQWIANARALVCMGGYNTICELLATDTPGLVVPRTKPRAEQQVRTHRLAELGLLDELSDDDLTPASLRDWLDEALTRPRRPRVGLNLRGLAAVRGRVDELLHVHAPEEVSHAV